LSNKLPKAPAKIKETKVMKPPCAEVLTSLMRYLPIKKMATNLKTPRIYLLITPPKESPKAIPGFSTKSKRSNPKSEMFSPK
jgi:hypothetical protein